MAQEPLGEVIVSLDPAQLVDYAAIATLRFRTFDRFDLPEYDLVGLSRSQGETYPDLIRRLRRLDRALAERGARRTWVIDATGVGRAVLDMARAAGIPAVGIVITGAEDYSYDSVQDVYRAGKLGLITAADAAVQSRRMRIAKGIPLLPVLIEELRELRATLTAAGRVQVAVPDTNADQHDDLVMALAQGCWAASVLWTPAAVRWWKTIALSRDPGDFREVGDIKPGDPTGEDMAEAFRVSESAS